jgi:uncharacterized protein (DUF2235 family)
MEPAEHPAAAGKAIVLFSDGTGNSSAKLFKTNVWRMYEAVDLGPAAPGKRLQISYYDDGVGTSSFAPLAALGGAFGWGLKRNVLDIYRYACRNYEPGDDIYIFGFSRGAFTSRLVAALIASKGLVRSTSEDDLRRKSVALYRSFRSEFMPRRLEWPTKVARGLRSAAIKWIDRRRGRSPLSDGDIMPATIRFIGVWDTVSAYGGPITEITRAIDNWFFALSMPDYHLHPGVKCARHALAIDDERDAFQPLLWDEVHEETLVEEKLVLKDRLQQVWFTGMHADVGGGYPDESLSYVSLLWMMEEAGNADLRILDVIKARIVALASSAGPLHDSRSGLGSYYRYQPRRIAAWLNPVDGDTLSLRDPDTDIDGRSRGLLQEVKVHESVIHRIISGTDRYAPITLPPAFSVVPPQKQGEAMPQADSEASAPIGIVVPRPMIDWPIVAALQTDEAAAARKTASEAVWNRVWWRRLTYFATLAATLLLLALPLYVEKLGTPPFLADGRTWIGGPIRLLTIVIPSFAGKLVEVYADNPFYFLALAVTILLLIAAGTRMERKLRDEMRAIWESSLAGKPHPARESWVQKFRTSRRYQRFINVMKWYVLPDVLIAPLTVAAVAWIVFAAYVQAWLPFRENGVRLFSIAALCTPSSTAPAPITSVSRDFDPKALCSESLGLVTEGARYTVTFDVLAAWQDASLPTNPLGLTASEFPIGLGYLAAPLKRVIDANYLQPLVEIRPVNGQHELLENIQIYPLDVQPVGDSATVFRAAFKAPRGGELFLFVNDAVLPFTRPIRDGWDEKYFYANNRGSACVTVESDVAQRDATLRRGSGAVCQEVMRRNAAEAAVRP